MSIFFSHYIPPNCTGLEPRFSQAGSNFINKLFALDDINFFHVKIIGIKKKTYDILQKNIQKGSYINNIFSYRQNKILKFINIWCSTASILKTIYLSKSRHIWFYNVLSYDFLFAALIAKYLFRKSIFVLLADYDAKNNLLGKLQTFVLNNVSGILSLRKLSPKIKCKNNIIIHGISISNKEISFNTNSWKKTCLFAGLLDKKLGFDLVLETFKDLPEIDLYISGKGNDEELAIRYSEKYPNIHYVGFLDFDRYLNLLNNISICLSLRSPNYESNNYEFPSKIIEFIENGKYVITNVRYENLPSELVGICNYDKYSLKNEICNIYSEKKEIRTQLNINEHFGLQVWQNAFKKLESVNK